MTQQVNIESVELNGKTISVGDFIFSNKDNANVEVLSLTEDHTRDSTSVHFNRIGTAGRSDSTFGGSYDLFKPEKETIFHEVQDTCCIEIARELVTEKEFIEAHS
tara:strand:- start:76260 stop:76574 length:315 start_codon:yes stop_codon:yes gene_type:complete